MPVEKFDPVHAVAFAELHVSVEVFPATTLVGFAVSVTVTAGGGFTVTVADLINRAPVVSGVPSGL